MRAMGYCRVSTDSQADKGISLDLQQEKIRAMAIVQSAELVDVIVEAESAKSLERPGMQKLLALVELKAIDTVIVMKLDRLTRSVKDFGILLEKFQKHGVSLISVAESLDTGSAAGRLVINIMVSVSQWEREIIGERTKDALQHKKSLGQRLGNIPYGWKAAADGKMLVVHPEEYAVVSRARTLREAGGTLEAIAAELNEYGLTTRRGTAWKHQYVAGILKQRAA